MNTPFLDDLMAEMHMKNKHAFIIRLLTDDFWYFFDMDTQLHPHPILWTQHISQAFWFPDEEAVEEFRMDFITPREVEILRIERR